MKYALWLSSIPGFTSYKIHRLLSRELSPQDVYGLSESQLNNIEEIASEDKAAILQSKREWNLEEEVWNLQKQGISFCWIEQKEYPKKLKNVIHPPYSLFYKGSLPDPNQKLVAIVGARTRSQYGAMAAVQLSRELVKQNIGIVSGMARGIDADAHQGALEAEGKTYGVLGCGVDICYPRQNKFLYDKIPIKGGILSEYPPKSEALAWHFPERNRIISGLCDAVVVVEARKKSGSLITADYALEQGKDVYALPGRVFDSLSEGCNQLIAQGAGVVTNFLEFAQRLGNSRENGVCQLNFRKNLLEKDELLVYSLLDFAPIGIGTLVDKSNLSLLELLGILERLEQKDFIEEMVPNYYVRRV